MVFTWGRGLATGGFLGAASETEPDAQAGHRGYDRLASSLRSAALTTRGLYKSESPPRPP